MNYEAGQALGHSQFKRQFGVQKSILQGMIKDLSAQLPLVRTQGRLHKLSIENQFF